MMRSCRPDGASHMSDDSFQGLAPLATDLRPAGAGRTVGDLLEGLAPLATDLRPFGAGRAMSDCRPTLTLLVQRTMYGDMEIL